MADTKISALTGASTPLAGTEVLPIVQSSATVKVSVANLTAGRAVSAASLALTTSPLPATSGGTGQSSYAVGDLLYASTTTALSKLADVATGSAVISGGVGVAPSYGKIGLTTHVSGTLPVANGGTNLTSFTSGGIVYASSASALATGSNVYYDGTTIGTVGRLYNGSASTFGASSWAMSLGNGGASTNYFKADNNYWQNAAGTALMDIGSTGNLTISGATATKASGTTWANPSDQRLKENIRDYPKGTTELMQVRVREWDYNGKGGTTFGVRGLGVVADEVMTVLPATVENYYAKLDAEDQEAVAIKKFDATEITWLLVKTIQEQQVLIESLNSRILALENR